MIRRKAQVYPPAAYAFVREGLEFTVQTIKGETASAELASKQASSSAAPANLPLPPVFPSEIAAESTGPQPPDVEIFIEQIAQPKRKGNHVTGQQLCEGLRQLALQRYGLLAPAVLHRWNVRTTIDFGVMVYAMIDRGELAASDNDNFDDFSNVFDFAHAFGPQHVLADAPAPIGQS